MAASPVSGKHFANHVARDVRQPEIAAVETIRQARVIESEQVQDRRLDVVDADAVLHRAIAEVVATAVVDAAAHTAAREEDRVGMGVVIASGGALGIGCATKFATPYHER